MNVLGLDPGIQHTGYAVLGVRPDAAPPASVITLPAYGVLTPHRHGDAVAQRRHVYTALLAVLATHRIDVIVIEDYVWQGTRRRADNAPDLYRVVGMLETLAAVQAAHGGRCCRTVLLAAGAWQRQLCGPGPLPKTHVARIVEQRLGVPITERRWRCGGSHAAAAAGVALAWIDQWLMERRARP